jgi:hypothetical protein
LACITHLVNDMFIVFMTQGRHLKYKLYKILRTVMTLIILKLKFTFLQQHLPVFSLFINGTFSSGSTEKENILFIYSILRKN